MEITYNVKLNALIELSRLKLAKILNEIADIKDITIESNLIKPLERICGAKWLRLNGVQKIYKFEDKPLTYFNTVHVYFIPSNIILFKSVLNHIQAVMVTNTTFKPHIIIIPKILNSFEVLLEELGLYGIVTLHSYCWELIQIDADILSLEIPNLFTDLYVSGDLSVLPTLGYSLITLFCVTGKPNILLTVGKYASSVLSHADIFSDHLQLPIKSDCDFDVLVVMDRPVDYTSILLTTATYAGLISEIFNVKCGIVENKTYIPENIEKPSTENNADPKKLSYLFSLDSLVDDIYMEIKHKHISDVTDILSNYTRQLKLESQTSKGMALSEMKTYVKTKLQDTTKRSRYLSCHLEACEKIIAILGTTFEKLHLTEQSLLENIHKSTNIKTIDDLILLGNEYMSLRLICLMSLTQKFTYEEYYNLKVKYLQTFGYKYLYVFDNLINSGLLVEPAQSKLPNLNISLPNIGTKKDFYSISNKLKLIPQKPEQINIHNPTCPSYVFSGCYIPVLAQLITFLIQAQSENEIKQKLDVLGGNCLVTGITKPFPLQRRSIIVFVIGGITYAEVSAIQFVEKMFDCKIIICSNTMFSGNNLVEACK